MVKKILNKKTTLKHGGEDHTFKFFWTLPYSVEITTFFQRTFGDNQTCVKIENKIFLLFTQKIAYYFVQCSEYCIR